MSDYKKWFENNTVSVPYPNVSGFVLLEMLQSRSHLEHIESRLSPDECTELESADAMFLKHVQLKYF